METMEEKINSLIQDLNQRKVGGLLSDYERGRNAGLEIAIQAVIKILMD